MTTDEKEPTTPPELRDLPQEENQPSRLSDALYALVPFVWIILLGMILALPYCK